MQPQEIKNYKDKYVVGKSVYESASLFAKCFFLWVSPAMKVSFE